MKPLICNMDAAERMVRREMDEITCINDQTKSYDIVHYSFLFTEIWTETVNTDFITSKVNDMVLSTHTHIYTLFLSGLIIFSVCSVLQCFINLLLHNIHSIQPHHLNPLEIVNQPSNRFLRSSIYCIMLPLSS